MAFFFRRCGCESHYPSGRLVISPPMKTMPIADCDILYISIVRLPFRYRSDVLEFRRTSICLPVIPVDRLVFWPPTLWKGLCFRPPIFRIMPSDISPPRVVVYIYIWGVCVIILLLFPTVASCHYRVLSFARAWSDPCCRYPRPGGSTVEA